MINIKKGLFVAILTVMFVPSLSFAAFDNSLRYGSKGQDVQELQEFLVEQGYLNHEPTGSFYALTLKAVKAFQLANGLPSTGYWGVMSRAKANELISLGASVEAEQAEVPVATTTTPVVQSTVSPVVFGQVPQLEVITEPVVTPTVSQPIAQEVKKEIRVEQFGYVKDERGLDYQVFVYYTENGKMVNDAVVTITSDDNGYFHSNGKVSTNSAIGEIKAPWGYAAFAYKPTLQGERTFTITVNGFTKTIKGQGNTPNAKGWEF